MLQLLLGSIFLLAVVDSSPLDIRDPKIVYANFWLRFADESIEKNHSLFVTLAGFRNGELSIVREELHTEQGYGYLQSTGQISFHREAAHLTVMITSDHWSFPEIYHVPLSPDFFSGSAIDISDKENGWKIHLTKATEHTVEQAEQAIGSCRCVKRNCACCQKFDLPHFNHHVCVNISYNAATIGLDLSVGVDNHYYTFEVSARNPPPVCYDIPGLSDVVAACIKFEDLNVARTAVSGCVEFEAELIHLRVFKVKLGCFKIPI